MCPGSPCSRASHFNSCSNYWGLISLLPAVAGGAILLNAALSDCLFYYCWQLLGVILLKCSCCCPLILLLLAVAGGDNFTKMQLLLSAHLLLLAIAGGHNFTKMQLLLPTYFTIAGSCWGGG